MLNHKNLVKRFLSCREPTLWVMLAALAISIIFCAVLLARPTAEEETPPHTGEDAPYVNYVFGELLYVNPLSSYYPDANSMPYFKITTSIFSAEADPYGASSRVLEPSIPRPVYKQRYAGELREALEPLEDVLRGYDSLQVQEVLAEDGSPSGYFILYAGEDVLLLYEPGSFSCWLIRLEPMEDYSGEGEDLIVVPTRVPAQKKKALCNGANPL